MPHEPGPILHCPGEPASPPFDLRHIGRSVTRKDNRSHGALGVALDIRNVASADIVLSLTGRSVAPYPSILQCKSYTVRDLLTLRLCQGVGYISRLGLDLDAGERPHEAREYTREDGDRDAH
jgi:hypothetical protein